MGRLVIIIFCLAFSSLSYAQDFNLDTLNRKNAKGKKVGYWLYYLDQHTNPVKSKEDAYYYLLEEYDEGAQMIFANRKHPGKPIYTLIVSPENKGQKGQPVLISGTFEWVDSKANRQVKIKEVYKDGVIWYIEEVVKNKHELLSKEILDRNKIFKNNPNSFYLEYYHELKEDTKVGYLVRTKGKYLLIDFYTGKEQDNVDPFEKKKK
jgi:hypothetical protein